MEGLHGLCRTPSPRTVRTFVGRSGEVGVTALEPRQLQTMEVCVSLCNVSLIGQGTALPQHSRVRNPAGQPHLKLCQWPTQTEETKGRAALPWPEPALWSPPMAREPEGPALVGHKGRTPGILGDQRRRLTHCQVTLFRMRKCGML